VHLHLSLGGRAIFHEGEIIPLRLSLTASTDDRYYADTRDYDRAGRLEAEVFCLEPPLGSDPLSGHIRGQMGGLSSGTRALGSEAFIFERELNEWRSVPPGRYQLRVRRHVDRAMPTEEGIGMVDVAVWSNAVTFEVVPAGPEWRSAQLVEALQALDSGEPDRARRGGRVLRFLGSEEAARELVLRYSGDPLQPHSGDLRLGIIGSPHRQAAIAALRSAVVDPEHPVTSRLVELLALLEVDSDPDYRLPPYDPEDDRAWRELLEARRVAQERLVQRYGATVAATFERKSLEARARSIDLVLQSAGSDPVGRAQAREQVIALWNLLEPRQQRALVWYRWEEIRGPELLPLLRRLVEAPAPKVQGPDVMGREIPLLRLYELSPEEGRGRILGAINEGSADLGPRVLGILPEQELPEVEKALLARIEAGRFGETDAFLIERYASARALARVRSAYEARSGWACRTQASLLRYFLRVDPEAGAAEVQAALSSRQRTGCYKSVLTDLQDAVRLPAVERIAIRALDDPGPEVAPGAAQALARYGSAEAEGPLWRRLERFHEEWKDEAHRFRRLGLPNGELKEPALLERALLTSIAQAQSWYCGPEKLQMLADLASPASRAEVERWIAARQGNSTALNLHWQTGQLVRFNIDGFSGSGLPALRQKLEQLPAGRCVNVRVRAQDRDVHRAELDEIERLARATELGVIIR
jgi:hypothetical protein